ncbi:hypothetical protein P7C70_g7318, partial [Phenoliferia sp. Uapishka_3]
MCKAPVKFATIDSDGIECHSHPKSTPSLLHLANLLPPFPKLHPPFLQHQHQSPFSHLLPSVDLSHSCHLHPSPSRRSTTPLPKDSPHLTSTDQRPTGSTEASPSLQPQLSRPRRYSPRAVLGHEQEDRDSSEVEERMPFLTKRSSSSGTSGSATTVRTSSGTSIPSPTPTTSSSTVTTRQPKHSPSHPSLAPPTSRPSIEPTHRSWSHPVSASPAPPRPSSRGAPSSSSFQPTLTQPRAGSVDHHRQQNGSGSASGSAQRMNGGNGNGVASNGWPAQHEGVRSYSSPQHVAEGQQQQQQQQWQQRPYAGHVEGGGAQNRTTPESKHDDPNKELDEVMRMSKDEAELELARQSSALAEEERLLRLTSSYSAEQEQLRQARLREEAIAEEKAFQKVLAESGRGKGKARETDEERREKEELEMVLALSLSEAEKSSRAKESGAYGGYTSAELWERLSREDAQEQQGALRQDSFGGSHPTFGNDFSDVPVTDSPPVVDLEDPTRESASRRQFVVSNPDDVPSIPAPSTSTSNEPPPPAYEYPVTDLNPRTVVFGPGRPLPQPPTSQSTPQPSTQAKPSPTPPSPIPTPPISHSNSYSSTTSTTASSILYVPPTNTSSYFDNLPIPSSSHSPYPRLSPATAAAIQAAQIQAGKVLLYQNAVEERDTFNTENEDGKDPFDEETAAVWGPESDDEGAVVGGVMEDEQRRDGPQDLWGMTHSSVSPTIPAVVSSTSSSSLHSHLSPSPSPSPSPSLSLSASHHLSP